MERRLDDLDLVAILIDGVNFDEQLLAVSMWSATTIPL